MGIIMSLKHPLVWSVIVSFCIASLVMPLLKRLGLAFGITAARAGGQSSTMVPVLGGPAIVAGFVLAAARVGMLAPWLALAVVLLCLAGVVDDAIALTPAQKLAAQV